MIDSKLFPCACLFFLMLRTEKLKIFFIFLFSYQCTVNGMAQMGDIAVSKEQNSMRNKSNEKWWLPYHGIRILVSKQAASRNLPLCSLDSLVDKYWKAHQIEDNSTQFEQRLQRKIEFGGRYRPSTCAAIQTVAIIVPLRDRNSQLAMFVANLHSYLSQQNVADYRIVVIEQNRKQKFNRAKLFNVGFDFLTRRISDHDIIDCFIFHDVEFVPTHFGNPYLCSSQPRHLALNYRGRVCGYENCFGGVTAISFEQMISVNGFNNDYWGWGGEDDDFRLRLIRAGYSIARLAFGLSRYTRLPCNGTNEVFEERFERLLLSHQFANRVGLNSLTYKIELVRESELYTMVVVDL